MILLTGLLLVLEVLSSFLLIGIILIQKSKGGGLGGSAFGGGGGESLFGARAGNVLTKLTIGLSSFFLANTLLLAFMYAESGDESMMQSATSAGPLEPLQPIEPPATDALDLPAPPIESLPPEGDQSMDPAPILLDLPTAPAPAPAPENVPVEAPAAP